MKKRGMALILAAAVVLGGCSSGQKTSGEASVASSPASESSSVSESTAQSETEGTTEAVETTEASESQNKEPEVKADEEKEADVIIVGAGGAGLAAAIAAADG